MAGFRSEDLITFARTNNRDISSVAVWALLGIVPAAAKLAGVRLP
jgi:hypothetical protein